MNPLAEWPYRCFKTSMTQTGSTSTPANVRIALAPPTTRHGVRRDHSVHDSLDVGRVMNIRA
jgi:hypothetical protein